MSPEERIMDPTTRRTFLHGAGAIAATSLFSTAGTAGPARRMRMCLNCGNIGVRANLAESIAMASRYGFETVDPNWRELAALTDSAMQRTLDELESKDLTFGSVALAFPIAQSSDAWTSFLRELATTAKTVRRARMNRLVTWLLSWDDSRTYLENFRLHARRVGEAAGIVADQGVRLGLEYLGPKTMWAQSRYPFIHTMAEMKELIAEIQKPNVGFLLDIWHWYNAGDTVADVLTLKNEDVVAVHMSDAPANIPKDQQIDNHRELPLATGVIDTAGFLNALNRIGYDGPAAAEPFNADLRAMPPEQALAKTAAAMKKAFALIQ
jgi:sugar phosphate isomerase/epimerase